MMFAKLLLLKYSFRVEAFNFQHDDEGVVMWLLGPICISFKECDIVTFWSLILWGWMLDVDTIDLPVIRLL